jgi:hypothetical protein
MGSETILTLREEIALLHAVAEAMAVCSFALRLVHTPPARKVLIFFHTDINALPEERCRTICQDMRDSP